MEHDFATLLRRHRQRRRLTQEALADRAEVSARTVRAVEHGRGRVPRPATVARLADALTLDGPDRAAFLAAGETAYWRRREPGTAPPRPESWPARPAQLPMPVRPFHGRRAELAALDAALRPAPDTDGRLLATLTGMPGVGKTALAVHWAYAAADAFPDGTLFCDLHGFGPVVDPRDPADVLHDFLDALAMPADRIPDATDARSALFRSVTAGRRLLVVLDNAAAADQVRPLLPGGTTSRVLVTSRNRLSGLHAAAGGRAVAVEPLPAGEARDLVRTRLGARRSAAEPAAVDQVVASCAGLPLALATVTARLMVRPDDRLAALAAELRTDTRTLDALGDPDPAVDTRAALTWSYRGQPQHAGRP